MSPVFDASTGKMQTGMRGAIGPCGPRGSAGIVGSVGLGMAAMSVGTSSFRRSGDVNLEEWEEVPDEVA